MTEDEKMRETVRDLTAAALETEIRALARNLREHPDRSLHVIVDGDGTWVYQWTSPTTLAQPEMAHLELDLLLKRREDVRGKTFGTGA